MGQPIPNDSSLAFAAVPQNSSWRLVGKKGLCMRLLGFKDCLVLTFIPPLLSHCYPWQYFALISIFRDNFSPAICVTCGHVEKSLPQTAIDHCPFRGPHLVHNGILASGQSSALAGADSSSTPSGSRAAKLMVGSREWGRSVARFRCLANLAWLNLCRQYCLFLTHLPCAN
ncbi:unnamed protein product [Protopolystoma xenopodis]|uniref:Uncharacterized protein n=1 Tax=Protopolystoma xenopodis TaxID=117903 RepID=A0A3S5ACN3_9PLAT|nr:unnamed protein product [Protopolystoma xenopodis]